MIHRPSISLLPGPIVAAVCIFVLGMIAGPAHADEFDDFSSARTAFDSGNYYEAANRFEQMLQRGVVNPALLLEVHKLAGISYLFIGEKDKSEHHFFELLTRASDYTLDPMVYPIEVIDYFADVKSKNNSRIAELSRTRKAEAEKRRLEEEARRQAELEKLKRNIYYEKNRRIHSPFISYIPFGAGQFQNGETTKAWLYLGGEALLLAATITTFALHARLHETADEPFESQSEREKFENYELGYRIANWASLGSLVALATVGIVDAVRHYEPETVTWERVDEKDAPERFHGPEKQTTAPEAVRLSFRPLVNLDFWGLDLVGTF